MVATTTERRNFWLDAFAGHPEYSYVFNPLTSDQWSAMLCHGGIPGEPGAFGLSGQSLLSLDSSNEVYPDAVDGATKTYTGGTVTFPLITEDLDTATHLLIFWGDSDFFGWVFEFETPLQMLSGRAVQITLPSITLDAEGNTVIGMTDDLRLSFLGQLFSDSVSPLGPGEYWDLALYRGDPLEDGVEVDNWDYEPLRVQNTITFVIDDVHTVFYRPFQTVRFVRCYTDWGEITHWGWKDVSATPTLYYSAPFDQPLDAVAGTLIEIEADALVMTFGDPVT